MESACGAGRGAKVNWKYPETAAYICLALLLLVSDSSAGILKGRLLEGKEPVAGGVVTVYTEADFKGGPVAVSDPTGTDGTYSMTLYPGRYVLTASAGDSWAYCGQNPVTVDEGETWVGFELMKWKEPEYVALKDYGSDGQLRGVVTFNGAPSSGVTIYLYLDPEDNFRGPGFIRSAPTGDDGVFTLDLVPEAGYFVLARRRKSGDFVGPVMKGDFYSYYRFNPVNVRSGSAAIINLPLQEKKKDNDIHGVGLMGKEAGFEGVIRDASGVPVKGIHVFAYREPEMGHHRPAAISSLSDKDGRYRIFLPAGGRYYIGARGGFGDSPEPGEYFGYYEDDPEHSVTFDRGEFKNGVDMVVIKVLEP